MICDTHADEMPSRGSPIAGAEIFADLAAIALDQFVDRGLFVREELVEGADRRAGSRGDRFRRQLFVADLVDQRRGGVEQRIERVLAALLARRTPALDDHFLTM